MRFMLTSLVLSAAFLTGGFASADDPPASVDEPKPPAEQPLKERVRDRVKQRKELRQRKSDRDEGDWRRYVQAQLHNLPGTPLQIDVEAIGVGETGEDGRPRSRRAARIVIVGPDGVTRQFTVGDPDAAGLPPSQQTKYRIGITIEPVPDVARAQLKLPADRGIVVWDVFAGSPAAKSGLKRHDILLTADGQPLKSIDDLIELLEETGTEPMTITLLREGEEQSVDVAPVELEEWDLPKVKDEIRQQLQGQLHNEIDNLIRRRLDDVGQQVEDLGLPPRVGALLEELQLGPADGLELRSVGPGVVIEEKLGADAAERDNQHEALTKKLDELTKQIEALQKAVDDLRAKNEN